MGGKVGRKGGRRVGKGTGLEGHRLEEGLRRKSMALSWVPKSVSSAKTPELKTVAKGAGVKAPTRNLTKSLVKLGEEVNGMVGEELTDMVWVNGKLMMSKTFVDGMETKHVQKTKNGILSGGRRRRRSS